MAKDLNDLVNLMLSRKYMKAKYFRRAIDQNKSIRQRFELSEGYRKRFEEFVSEANKAAESGGEFSRFKFEGKTFQAGSALRTEASVRDIKGEFGRANFRQQAYTMKKLFPELAEGQELGHKNISVLRVAIVAALKELIRTKPKDPKIPPLRALYQLVLNIDKITEVGEKTFPELLSDLETSIAKGLNVKTSYSKDVNILSGAIGSLEFGFEPKELNQDKGRLAAQVGEIFRDVILGGNVAEEVFKGIDITQIKGSPSMKQDIEKQLVDLLDPKKKQRKSRSKTSAKGKGGGKKVALKRPKKSKASLVRTRRTKKSAFNIGYVLGILNQQLPETVAGNMGSPRLNYRTGRFANSVRATDIAITNKGFPSIGYTYQLYPYQTFEPGFRQGSVERDPRKLIDKSIREIMLSTGAGRIYTRRQG